MVYSKKKSNQKQPPIFSHEFVIQNHGDIVSCAAMIVMLGLMFQPTANFCSKFTMLSYNVTEVNATYSQMNEFTHYHIGRLDILPIFFYFLLAIVAHAVIQEYITDKISRRFHLSKTKQNKYNLSVQVFFFYLAASAYGGWIVHREGWLVSITEIWDNYPHRELSVFSKLFFLAQIAYWLHLLPTLYFQKVRKEDMMERIQLTSFFVVFITTAYLLNLSRIATVLLVAHYLVEFLFHVARILYLMEQQDLSQPIFFLWAILYVVVRIFSVVLAGFTFLFGLRTSDTGTLDVAVGNYNILPVRVTCFSAIALLQLWLVSCFVTFQMRRMKDRTATSRKFAQKQRNKRENGEVTTAKKSPRPKHVKAN